MHASTRLIVIGLALAPAAAPAVAQEFRPPSGSSTAPVSGVAVDLYSFSVRGGVDVSRSAQWVLGTSFDLAELWSPRVRLRPSVEVG